MYKKKYIQFTKSKMESKIFSVVVIPNDCCSNTVSKAQKFLVVLDSSLYFEILCFRSQFYTYPVSSSI